MNQIICKDDIIKYFQDGCKTINHQNIGIEHEKFIFEKKSNKRVNFRTISKVLDFLYIMLSELMFYN